MIEDTRQPEFTDHSGCDDCGTVFDNSDLNELPNDEWLCDDCLKNRKRHERQEWEIINVGIGDLEKHIEKANDEYHSISDDKLNNLCDLLERARSVVNKLT